MTPTTIRKIRAAIESLESRQYLTTFTVTTEADSGPGSLRQAILDANATSAPDDIHFAIGSGAVSIKPLTPLPALYAPAVIDATTQPGFDGKPLVELSGELVPQGWTTVGLSLNEGSDGSTVKGLVINQFSLAGVLMRSSGNTIAGNYIGTDATGTSPAGNGVGVYVVLGTSNTIGGTIAEARNVISGNDSGLNFQSGGGESNANKVQGNYVGTDYTGTQAVPNRIGVLVSSSSVDVGGVANVPVSRNVIAGNTAAGFQGYISWGSKIEHNLIGISADGNPLGNGDAGVNIFGSQSQYSPAKYQISLNQIAHNAGAGVVVNGYPSTRVFIGQNSIHDNGGLGIDIGGDGVDSIDPKDVETGPNERLNAPTLDSVVGPADARTVYGSYHGLSETAYVIDFYRSTNADPSGFGEGQTYLKSVSFLTGADGNYEFAVPMSGAFATGETISATVTRNVAASSPLFSGRVTSEFSNGVSVPPPAEPLNLTLQAESATRSAGAAVGSQHAGYTGTGYVNLGAGGNYVDFEFTAPVRGEYEIVIRYANGGPGSRPADFHLNGQRLMNNNMPTTGGWTTWKEIKGSVELLAGVNHFRLTSTWANGANIDAITVKSPGAVTPPPATPITLQAETGARSSGAAVGTGNKGYTGSGYVNLGTNGNYVQFTTNVASAGSQTLTVRYANGSTINRSMSLAVNGVPITSNNMAPTGNWTTWKELTFLVDFVAGVNTIRLTSTGASGANIDSVTLSGDGTTPPPVDSVTVQAESATRSSGAVVGTQHKGFTGGGYVNVGSNGNYIQFTADRAAAGTATIKIRYANGSTTNRPLKLDVNSTTVSANLAFNPTTSWATWSEVTIVVDLLAGVNTIRLTSIGASGPNIDSITIV